MKVKEYMLDFSTLPYNRDFEERAVLPFDEVNYLIGGLELGEISIIAGETGSGKTTFISQCVAEIIKQDKMMCVYGESTIEKQAASLFRQMTPYSKENYIYKQYYKNGKKTKIGSYFISEEQEQKIRKDTEKKLFLYDPKKGMKIEDIINAITLAHTEGGINYFLIDNIMQFETMSMNEIKEIKDNVELLRRYVIDNKVHLILVAHYRKAQDYSVIRRRIEDILGTSAIGNKCATAINIIRTDNIIKTNDKGKEAGGWKALKDLLEKTGYSTEVAENCNSIVEVLKTRHNRLGFVAMNFDKITNTYKECVKDEDVDNPPTETQPKQTKIEDDKLPW